MLIIDETHFAARADEYGKPLRPLKKYDIPQSYEKADADEEVDADRMKEMVKVLDSDIRLHLSGTPYRILMGSEFKPEDIISFCQFTDIIQEQQKWNDENLGKIKVDETGKKIVDKNGNPIPYEEWDNPYYGFPQMIRFAFNLNDSARKKLEALETSGRDTSKFSELFRTQSIEKDSSKNKFHRKFVHEKEVLDLLKAIDGAKKEQGILPFLNYKKIKEGQMCHHIVCVLPWCASCDALEDLLNKNKRKFSKLGEYKILNISGKDVKRGFVKIADITNKITECEKRGEKTLTLTVNRMLTGSTVPEWDTMLFLKDTSSPQEYDQAIFRLQNKFTRIMTDKDGNHIEFNMKPQTLLVDFDPDRMFRLQEARAQYYNLNTEKNGNKELENRIAHELEVSPIILFNKDKIHQVVASDIMSAISKYSSKRGVAEEVQEIPLDIDVCKNAQMRAFITKLPEIGSKEGLTIKPHEGDETGIDTDDRTREANDGDAIPNEQPTEKSQNEEDVIKRLKTYHALILFYSFLVPYHVNSLDDILKVIYKDSDTKRIAKHLGIEKSLLELYRNTVNWHTLQKLDYKIQNLNHLSEESESIDIGQEYKDAPKNIKKAIVAMQKFGRLGESKIITPQNIAYDMVKQIPAKEFKKLIKNGEKILDPASKMGEFAIAIVRRCTDPDINLKIDNVKDSILSIPMCEITYEFTRKIYELLELNTKCIALPENLTSYMLRNVKKDNNETLDFVRISKLLTQSKDFDKVTINDNTSNKGKTMSIKIGAVIGNPPYHIKDGGAGASAAPIYPDLYRAALATSARYVSVVIPSRWYAGGKGLDEFRDDMLNDSKIIELHDFPDPNDCFPGLSVNLRGGSCYLLRNSTKRDGSSLARIYTHSKDGIRCSNRALRTPGYDIFLRYEESIPILNKVLGCCGDNVLSKIVSSRKPFGLPTDFYKTLGFSRIKPAGNSVKCIAKGLTTGYVLRSKITVNPEWISRWKVFIPRANNIGTELNDDNLNTFIFEKETVCTESYLVVGGELNLTKKECDNLAKYLHTRFVRCLHGFAKASQDATSKTFRFVPIQDFSSSSDIDWSQSIAKIDEQLYSKYSINKAEVEFIKSLVNPME